MTNSVINSGIAMALCVLKMTALAEPLAVRPLEPITENAAIIGFSSNDPTVEFTSPDAWILKKNGAILKPLEQGHYDLVLLLEPSYALAEQRELQNQLQGIFKVYLPIPMKLLSAKLYVSDLVGELKAEFVPYPGNAGTGFYFRINLDSSQLSTLDRLTVQKLTFTGEASFDIDLADFHTNTTAPIKVALPRLYTPDGPFHKAGGSKGNCLKQGQCSGHPSTQQN